MVKIGLIAPINNTGVGHIVKQLYTHLGIGIHLIIVSPSRGTNLEDCPVPYLVRETEDSIHEFIEQKPDVVLIIEHPADWAYIRILHEAKIPVVMIHLIDSVPIDWIKIRCDLNHISLFITPTLESFNLLESMDLPCKHFPWPTDTDLFSFKQRGIGPEITFLHNVGHGGHGRRKGWDLVLRAWQELQPTTSRLIVHSQTDIRQRDLLANVDFRLGDVDDPVALYDEGDVYLSPSRREGIGLPFREAMACGLPAIVSDIPPFNEIVTDSDLLVACGPPYPIKSWGPVSVNLHEPDIDDLIAKMRGLMEPGVVAQKSKEARAVIHPEGSWVKLAPKLRETLEALLNSS